MHEQNDQLNVILLDYRLKNPYGKLLAPNFTSYRAKAWRSYPNIALH